MKETKWPILISTLLMTGSFTIYAWLGNYNDLMAQNGEEIEMPIEQLTSNEIRDKRITALQQQLYQDKQNGELWYQLGHAYLLNAEYENAVTVFDYAIRLTESLTSDHYSAKATALYYVNKQKMTDEVHELVTLALEINENNQTAIMLLANDQFMQARYQQAISLWVKLLDSDQADMDRVGIIHRINQAKQFIK